MSSVFLMVFDGLQPSQVTPELMPNLWRFAEEGVRFERHHPVYPTVTRINAASMVTGCSPGRHGLAANLVVMRELDPGIHFQVLEPDLRRLGAIRDGRVLLAPPLAEILTPHGMQYVAVGVGTSGNAFVHNAHPAVSSGATVHPDFCLPDQLHREVLKRFGEWPAEAYPNSPRVRHAGRIITEYVLPERAPAVTLFWSSEPDKSQHAEGVNSPLARAALADADAELGRVLAALDDTGLAADTDVMVLSDHGYSTIIETIPVAAMLNEAGFGAPGEQGGVLAAENGGSMLFYTHPFDPATADRLAAWLMSHRWCGPVLASEAVGDIPGTLPLALSGGDGVRAPDLIMSFAWDSRENSAGVPGHSYSSKGKAGTGQHGSMSRHELRNTLIARGPHFRVGVRSETPSGNVDIAPTILHLLGIPAGLEMDGRVLHEALRAGESARPTISVQRHSAERIASTGAYRQEIQVSHVNGTCYLDEGKANVAEVLG
ncbi:MAG: alkaline phosphatase family protein [Dehalococcoidia bacterium]